MLLEGSVPINHEDDDQRKREIHHKKYQTFSIRIKDETTEKLNKLAEITNRSRNELINILLDYAIDNCEVNANGLAPQKKEATIL